MPSAREARDWAAAGGLHGIGDSLYTPFSGRDGDDIDLDAYRALVRYCVGDLGHEMLWLTSGLAEWWALTTDERKLLVEVAVDEARQVAPSTVIQACTSSMSAKEAVELTLHAQRTGADICYLQTPPMELHGGEGALRFYRYVADRTDIALGLFNSPSSGYVLTPDEIARIHDEVPAVCAIKQGTMHYAASAQIHRLAPELVIWECDLIAYRAGWLQLGILGPAQLGTAGYLQETPDKPMCTEYWRLIWAGELTAAAAYAEESGYDRLMSEVGPWYTGYPGRPGYFTHWGEAFRYAASVLGLPLGDYPHGRAPQGLLPEEGKQQIRRAFENAGLVQRSVEV
ncbi:dihydrodipicolinate synthase family protein [Nocardia sp. alder85J]|uniref:dihydrodipicolinate synthase family protein n=1 Tax=Nocardia sp. alder85J TaxID=2862949 RepID=UPI001CD47344|nr:dihydrodipicolinate synthase family protein [Nocardia sp. alder85J]MCX4091481.1 dihydrodipicolinate synthase family protein [Nocardia sp. alder85J]